MKPSEMLQLRVLVPLYLWLMQAGKEVNCIQDLYAGFDGFSGSGGMSTSTCRSSLQEFCQVGRSLSAPSRDVWDPISLLKDHQGHSD